jgi:hypothetical protein
VIEEYLSEDQWPIPHPGLGRRIRMRLGRRQGYASIAGVEDFGGLDPW